MFSTCRLVETFNVRPPRSNVFALTRSGVEVLLVTHKTMRRAGVREARRNLTDLLNDVKKGREVVITDRGRPVARLTPVERCRPFPDLARVRRSFRGSDLALSQAVLEEREDRR